MAITWLKQTFSSKWIMNYYVGTRGSETQNLVLFPQNSQNVRSNWHIYRTGHIKMGIAVFIHPRKHDTFLIRKTRAKLHLNTLWTLNLLLNVVIRAHRSAKLPRTNTNWLHLCGLQQADPSMRKTSTISRNISIITVFHCEIYDPQIIPTPIFPSLRTAYFQLRVFKLPQRSSCRLRSTWMRQRVSGWSVPYISRQRRSLIFNV
jgi:hypothetical protein